MAYIFEKHNFKDYLHRNCHRNWFNKDLNIVYEAGEGQGIINSYVGEYVVRLEGLVNLEDPGIARVGDQIARNASGSIAIASGTVFLGSLLLAPFTGGASLIPAVVSGANATLQTAVHVEAVEEASRPGDVYFKLSGDKSEWVAKDISPWYANGGRKVWDAALDVNCWSNQVYEERYVHQIQAYVQQRPPTPWSHYTG